MNETEATIKITAQDITSILDRQIEGFHAEEMSPQYILLGPEIFDAVESWMKTLPWNRDLDPWTHVSGSIYRGLPIMKTLRKGAIEVVPCDKDLSDNLQKVRGIAADSMFKHLGLESASIQQVLTPKRESSSIGTPYKRFDVQEMWIENKDRQNLPAQQRFSMGRLLRLPHIRRD